MDLAREGGYRNAARVFFAKPPASTLRCAVFTSKTTTTILDQHDFKGDVLTLIEEAEKYVLKNIRIGMRLDGLARVDVPEISREALREAIINAFCHRDYRDSEEVRVAVFKNRVEIRNPGTLLDGMALRSLNKSHVSRRRNPLVADFLRRISYVEAWGRGISLITENAPKVKFRQIAGFFVAEFPRPELVSNGEPESGAQSEAILLRLCEGAASVSDLSVIIGTKTKSGSLKRTIKMLLLDGMIEYTIPDKPTSRLQKYRLTAKGRDSLHA